MSATARIIALVFGSGLCALVYQIVWTRELRLVFGASTGASAAVLAIFMGGLGIGGLLLGRRAERSSNPLRMYARLELAIALLAAATPLLLIGARALYLGLGGSATLGPAVATGARLLVALLVLAAPTFLMGGTLPAVAQAATQEGDRGRRLLGGLYATNTLGAVAGSFVATFIAIEHLGVRNSLWAAAALNLVVALLAHRLARSTGAREPASSAPDPSSAPPRRVGRFVVIAAGGVGFAFFAMELVWYRMLAPLLGGSSYSFGLILSVALLGVGIGALVYALGARARRPTLAGFAGTCALEACFLILPYAAGDAMAGAALALRGFEVFGFWGLVLSWVLFASVVILPPAIVAGYQFPLLVGLLGTGGRGVGSQLGLTYLANTLGAILGAISSGFGLIVLLSAPGVWLGTAAILVLLSLAAVALALREGDAWPSVALPAALALLTVALTTAPGPTAGWRHAPIGAGRFDHAAEGPQALERALRANRAAIVWSKDGIESSVGLHAASSYSFLINGKSDGNALGDAATTVMLSLIPATLHPEPKHTLVIGLGTGMSAGWLAEVPSVSSVDVIELEPAIEHVARVSAAVNHDVLRHPKAQLHYGDAREFLLTTSQRYDVIVSEPSNPWRAGVSSLFSRDFYEHAAARLAPDGVFGQWLQAYEIDPFTLRALLATLRSVFPSVEIWSTGERDLLLTARLEDAPHDLEMIRRRAASPPLATALERIWRVQGAEGFYAGYVAASGLADRMYAASARWIDTDARPVLEFGFSRGVGGPSRLSVAGLRAHAAGLELDRPAFLDGAPDWEDVVEARTARDLGRDLDVSSYSLEGLLSGGPRGARNASRHAYRLGGHRQVRDWWRRQPEAPRHSMDALMLADSLARLGDQEALAAADALASPTEAAIVRAFFHLARRQDAEAARQLAAAFEHARSDPWPHNALLTTALDQAVALAARAPEQGRALYQALADPFAVLLLEQHRLRTRLALTEHVDFASLCVEALAPFEPHVPWEVEMLERRLRCYEANEHPLRELAAQELERLEPQAAKLSSFSGRIGGALPDRF